MAGGLSAVFFGGAHDFRPQSSLLSPRIDREQRQVGTIAAEFNVSASDEGGILFGEKEPALLEQRSNRVNINTVALDEESFGVAKREVDQSGDAFCVGEF